MRETFATLCFAGAMQCLFLSLVLVARRNNRRANIFLSIYLVFMALDALELSLSARGLVRPALTYQISIIPYSLVFGPSMYLYIALLTAKINVLTKKYMLFYLPFAAVLAANIVFLLLFDNDRLPRAVIYVNMLTNGGGLILEAVFYIMALLSLQAYITRLKEYFSDIDALKLSFIRAGLLFIILTIPFFFIPYAGGHARREHEVLDAAAILASLLFIFVAAFIAMLQPEIFNRVRVMENAVPRDEGPSVPRYEKLRLPSATEEDYVSRLRIYMTEKKPYLDEELTLQDMADSLSVSTHLLSMILNIHFRQNFYNFVNSYRIEDVKRKLADPDYRDMNILTIAYGSGFNSKSTFNTMFKKFTGKTPREFRAGLS